MLKATTLTGGRRSRRPPSGSPQASLKVAFVLSLLCVAPFLQSQPAESHPGNTGSVAGTLDHIVLSVDKPVLQLVRVTNDTARLALTAVCADGTRQALQTSEAVIVARTKEASGGVPVVQLEGGRVVPKEGGIATLEAVLARDGREFRATTDIVVTPFHRDYHQTLVLKLFLGMEGTPVERLQKEPLFQKPHDVLCTFEEALEVIRKTDNLTRGIPKIIYLVGWQKGGHDHGYPAWDEVNSRLKRAQDATALASLRWLIREARQFHTTVSLHLNMVDAYEHSPLWSEYVATDCIARDADGKLYSPGIQMKGDPMFNVVYPREWDAGLAQRRIDRLIAMIPELRDGHTIHVDVFIAQRENGAPISPWHAKPENGGLTPDKYVATQRKIFHYWRDQGFDVTGEGIFWAHPRGEGFTGLQAMSWWYPGDLGYQMRIPERLMARGRTDRNGDGDSRFGSSMHGEEIWQKDKDHMPGFLGMFCRTTLPWFFLSRLDRVRFEGESLYYSDGVVARVEGEKKIIRKGSFVLREDDHLFVPALWNEREIIAYSRLGFENKAWQAPEEWRDVGEVDLRQITQDGCVMVKQRVPVTAGSLVLSLAPDEALSIVPSATRP
ncbi:MAG: endo-alpha-N-acetylgalactosaminidase family protein [Verrucomicrobiia bacterium]